MEDCSSPFALLLKSLLSPLLPGLRPKILALLWPIIPGLLCPLASKWADRGLEYFLPAPFCTCVTSLAVVVTLRGLQFPPRVSSSMTPSPTFSFGDPMSSTVFLGLDSNGFEQWLSPDSLAFLIWSLNLARTSATSPLEVIFIYTIWHRCYFLLRP